jgi:hypothetical protein
LGQAPEKISYQAIIRNADQSLVSASKVNLKMGLRQKSITGAVIYEETHYTSTNSSGLVSLEIGKGTESIGDFSKIPWADGPFFLEIGVDVNGGMNYAVIGISELLSVPYALHAITAEKLAGDDGEYANKAKIVPFKFNRDVLPTDIGNTIECTSSATLTLTKDFIMEIGETINLEAHNGAVLTIMANTGVTINYTIDGEAGLVSDPRTVRFGLLRKIADNAFIISGQ